MVPIFGPPCRDRDVNLLGILGEEGADSKGLRGRLAGCGTGTLATEDKHKTLPSVGHSHRVRSSVSDNTSTVCQCEHCRDMIFTRIICRVVGYEGERFIAHSVHKCQQFVGRCSVKHCASVTVENMHQTS